MKEIYKDSIASVYTSIYVNGVPADADGLPTVSVINADTNIAEIENQVSTKATLNQGEYRYRLTPEVTSKYGVYKIVWAYTANGYEMTNTDYIAIVVPYASFNEIRNEYSHLDSMTFREFRSTESMIRRIIEMYTAQIFAPQGSKTFTVRGTGQSTLNLPERIYELEHVSDGNGNILFGDYQLTQSGELWGLNASGNPVEYPEPVDNPDTIEDESKINYVWFDEDSPYSIHWDTDKDNVFSTGRVFIEGGVYNVKAKVGYRYVPPEVEQAAKILIASAHEPEYAYHAKGMEAVSSADYRLDFAHDPYSTTGNVNADQLLSQFVNLGVHVF